LRHIGVNIMAIPNSNQVSQVYNLDIILWYTTQTI